MNNSAILVRINSIEKHPNADKLQIIKLFGTQVITGMDAKQGDLMVYFDSNLRLSDEFLRENNLYKHPELNKDTNEKGYFEENGRVKAIKLRGEFSDGVVMPLDSFNYIADKYPADFEQGYEFVELFGHKICEKYVPVTKTPGVPGKQGQKKKKTLNSPMFVEHYATGQFFKNQHIIPANSVLYIMEKTHGTSGRIAHALIETTDKKNWFQKLFMKLAGIGYTATYEYIHGSRRVVLGDPNKDYNAYHNPTMREEILNKVKGLLDKGQQIYFEIYGYETTGAEIQKGFTYGCKPKEYKVKLYRVTMNNEDGKTVDYSLQYVIEKAKELGFEAPHIFETYYYDGTEESMKILESKVIQHAQGQSVMDIETLKEGVIVQFIDKNGHWECLKYKSDAFRNLESGNKDKGIIDQEDIS